MGKALAIPAMVEIPAMEVPFGPFQLDALRRRAKIVIVGEAVSRAGGRPFDGRDALGRERKGGSGWRLAKLLGVTPQDLQNHPSILLTNLFKTPQKEWNRRIAMQSADALTAKQNEFARLWIYLGQRVADAFYFDYAPLDAVWATGNVALIMIPHPSGRNLFWNSEYRRRKAKKILTALIAEALR